MAPRVIVGGVVAGRGVAIGAIEADQAARGLIGGVLQATLGDDGLGQVAVEALVASRQG
jgi:hypothetical protein